MDAQPDHSGESLIESETNLQAEGSTLAGLAPRSLTPTLDLLMVLVPVSQATPSLAGLIGSLEARVEPPFGLLVVYEPTDAETLALVTEFARTRPWLDRIPNDLGPGPVNALRTGFRAVGHGPVAVVSATGSDDPRDLARMRRLYSEGHPVVATSRERRGGRRAAGSCCSQMAERLLNRMVCRLSHLPLTDPLLAYRLYDAALVNELRIDSDRIEDVPLELAVKVHARGLPLVEIPTIAEADATREGRRFRCLNVFRWWRCIRLSRGKLPASSALVARTRQAS